ncbi:AAA family ATPase [Pseudomonas aeruginosa]|uniref:AAA family ATPase n=1 Tax=Pseudomonas aeruginosa TaxID=287 RepID=UPI001BD69998|nr:AAA family ATPase [Pseudomonas aeruginosa]ELP3489915.1 AAA family ATPase [Pseudomonas aeruginosa]MDP5375300.1 AAA family ATPase [Pseudomonas aeruginosa]HCE6032717.1 AAA family ATPase [Pseudomonas aeruginosa]HCF4405961.1 AAA family ATPase [Pseudomonas aeruginosa]
MRLKQLCLRDYRCFEAIDIDFHPKLTVLVAVNGAGKTSILDAIAVAFGPYVGAFDEAVGKHFEPSDIRQFRARETVTHEMEYAAKGVRLEASGFIPGSLIDQISDDQLSTTWRRSLSGPTKTKTSVKDAKELSDYGKRMQEAVRTPGNDVLLPLIAYYGTGRLWQQKNQKKQSWSEKIQRTSRTIGYTDCLDPASKYKAFVDWFRYWNFNAKEARIKAHESGQGPVGSEFDGYIQSVSAAVNTCLQPAGWKDIEYSFSRDALVARHDEFGELPVELLSDGIRNMIGMVADIAFRATKLNGHLGAQAATQTPGIVLIDEVDMHLHPRWQQVILAQLREAFPNIQFIVTTHSPQVLTTVPSECIRILRGNKVYSAPPGTEGAEPERLLKQVLGLEEVRPPTNPATQELKEYLALVDRDQWNSPRALELRKRLDERYQGQEPALLDADLQIENRKWELGE